MSNGKQIAKLLRKAADEYLWDGVGKGTPDMFSCFAVSSADFSSNSGMVFCALKHMRSLGLTIHAAGQFDEFKRGKTRQGARFLWLHFAALVAEDDGA